MSKKTRRRAPARGTRATRSRPPTPGIESDPDSHSITDLLDAIVRSLGPMPVRLIEAAVRRGDEVGPLAAALLEEQLPGALSRDRTREPIWLAVVLGRLAWPGAVPSLLGVVERADTRMMGLPVAAAEALARIGPDAVDGLVALLDGAPPHCRIRVYSALRGMDDARARLRLQAAVSADPELAPLLALREVYDEWIADRDFRLRYRAVPWLGTLEPGWCGWAVLEHQAGRPLTRTLVPDRPFPRVLPDPPPTCGCCDEPTWQSVGTLVCTRTAVFAPAFLHRTLAEAQERDGFRDMFEVMDALENAANRALFLHRPSRPMRNDQWSLRMNEICELWQGCAWVVEEGIEDVSDARERLLDELCLVAGVHGDPERIVAWSEHGPSRIPPVWRRPWHRGRRH